MGSSEESIEQNTNQTPKHAPEPGHAPIPLPEPALTRSRADRIARTSGLSICVNLAIAIVRIAFGFATASIAILTEGVNNAMDAGTSVLTLVGTKLSGKHPDAKHPFGYGRIEYLTSLTIAVIILYAGIEMLTEGVKLIIHPAPLSISLPALIAVAVSAVIKFCHGSYTIRVGEETGSKALEAIGHEGKHDSYASVLTIASAVIFLVFHISIDAYVGIFMALLILKTGVEVLRETAAELIGRPGQKELADKLYREIRKTPGVLGAADMMLHNYGPERWSGSVNIEVDHSRNVGDLYDEIHRLQLAIMHRYHVVLVFGIYAVDNDSEEGRKLRQAVGDFVRRTEHVTSFHALYLDTANNRLYCDLVVDYELRDWDGVRTAFLAEIREAAPNYDVELTIETEYV